MITEKHKLIVTVDDMPATNSAKHLMALARHAKLKIGYGGKYSGYWVQIKRTKADEKFIERQIAYANDPARIAEVERGIFQ